MPNPIGEDTSLQVGHRGAPVGDPSERVVDGFDELACPYRGRGIFHDPPPGPIMDPPPVKTVLVGVDGSDGSIAAAEYAVAIASRYGAELVALHVVDTTEYRAMSAGERDPQTISADGQALLEDIEADATSAGVPMRGATAYGFDVHRKLVHPGSAILDAAEDAGADFIVLPREGEEGTTGAEGTLAKAAEYALLYASQPVLAV